MFTLPIVLDRLFAVIVAVAVGVVQAAVAVKFFIESLSRQSRRKITNSFIVLRSIILRISIWSIKQ